MSDRFALLERLEHHASARPGGIAFRCVVASQKTSPIAYAELAGAVRTLAGEFRSKLAASQTLLICSPNCIELAVALLAGFAAGVRVFPVSCEASNDELLRLATESRAAGLVGSPAVVSLLRNTIRSVWPIENVLSVRSHSSPQPFIPGSLILQSSGTTGFPRLVHRTTPSIDAVSRGMVESIHLADSDRILALLPLSHSYGIEHGLLAPIWAGAETILGHGLDLRTLQHELLQATVFPTVPSAIEILADLPGEPIAMPHLRRIYSAGGPLPRSVFDRFSNRFGLRVTQLYGATEVGSVTYQSPEGSDFDPASVGLPMPGVQICIVDQHDPKTILPANAEGHVHIKADSMLDRYLDDLPTLINGYFPTGDLGRLDPAGRLTITGRIKLLIDVGGLKVNPIEVESILREDPRVGNCVVIPTRQSETVYRVKAIITPRNPSDPPNLDTLRALARRRLATYKVPRVFELRDSLPTTSTGKVLRNQVRDER